ncbi:DUF975 family protein [Lacticaseibacillus parakribbianus]|uniref:DUF975 family protein n=1 Tax=Lacticaseibacillus parakribbianus TaxID=2970927 RepID=UPI0021CB03ED|nr:DUF975 family protein [Lacticaseibacillus parakribbianus]
MAVTILSRREIKRRAHRQLHDGTVFRDLAVANLIPWLITVVFAILAYWTLFESVTKFGVANIAYNPQNFADYYAANSGNTVAENLFEGLVSLWFTQALAFTALDVTRGQKGFAAGRAVFRTFNSRYFFGVLAVWITALLVIGLGLSLLVIPGLVLAYGLRMAFFTLYDGREKNDHYSFLAALGDSWLLMRGHKFDYFVLELTLIGWQILETVTFHLFDLLIDPYLQLVKAGYYDNLTVLRDQQQAPQD